MLEEEGLCVVNILFKYNIHNTEKAIFGKILILIKNGNISGIYKHILRAMEIRFCITITLERMDRQ